MMRVALAAAALAAIVVVRAASTPVTDVPLVAIPQGVTLQQPGGEPVFLLREGSVVRGFLGRSTAGGDPIVYCPHERAFVAPTDQSLWTEQGAWVGGRAPRDLDQVRIRVDPKTHLVRIDPRRIVRAKGRSRGEVSGETGERYAAFRAGVGARFCEDAFPSSAIPPELRATPGPS